MARSTGPILAVGGLTLSAHVLDGRGVDLRVPVATGVAAAVLAVAEKAWPAGAVALAWSALVTVLLVRIDNRPSPVEVFVRVLNARPTGVGTLRPAPAGKYI